MSKVSIIIPNYNNASFIKKSIESIINQTYKNTQIIIVDDGSTDNSKEVINRIIEKNASKEIIFLKQYNSNGAIARNRGLEFANGKYVFFLDSDDYMAEDNVLEKMINDIKENDLLIGNYNIIDFQDSIIKKYQLNNDDIINVSDCYKYSMISPVPSNKLFKKDIIDKNNIYFSNVRIGQDLNFYLKYLSCCRNIITVNYNIYNYRMVNTGVTKSVGYNIFDMVKCFEEIEKYYIQNNNQLNYNKYISLVKLKHFNFQMGKYSIIKSKDFRKSLILFYKHYYKEINTQMIVDRIKFKKIDGAIKKKFRLYLIITSNLFCSLRKKMIIND